MDWLRQTDKHVMKPHVKAGFRVNPNSLSYPFSLPLPLSFARSLESKGSPNSRFDRGVWLRRRGRYPLKPRIFTSLLETKGYPEHTAARSSREYFWLNLFKITTVLFCALHTPVTYIYICNHALN